MLPEENIVMLDAGHWVHFDRPRETLDTIVNFLDRIDN